jgi:hypothetical protein
MYHIHGKEKQLKSAQLLKLDYFENLLIGVVKPVEV